MRNLLSCACFVLLAGLQPRFAAAQVYNVSRISTSDGLIQSQVMALMQDRFGYLWIGTHRGVSRYDGHRFADYGAAEGIRGNFIADLLEDRSGAIWIASDNGLTRYDRVQFQDFTTAQGLPENDIKALAQEPAGGRLWIGGRSKGLAWLEGGQILIPGLQWDGVSAEQSIQALLFRRDTLWIGTLSGLFYLAPQEPQRVRRFRTELMYEVYDLLNAQDGSLWAGGNTGAIRIAGGSAQLISPRDAGLSDPAVYCLAEGRDGRIWIGTGNGILHWAGGTARALNRKDRSLDYTMRSALADTEGNLWFGTDGGGLRNITEGMFEAYSMQDSLTSNIAKSFLEDAQGRIWVITRDQGINLISNGAVRRYYTTRDGLGGNAICYSLQDRSGHFWLASYNGTLTRFAGGAFRVYNGVDGLHCNAAYAVAEMPDGSLWVGTDNGIFVREGERFVQRYHTGNGLTDNTVYAIRHDRQGRIWVGGSQGLSVIEAGAARRFEAPDSVIGANVITLLEDSRGRFWIGSSAGLAFFDENTPHDLHISGASGANTVVALVEEPGKGLWIGTENGAYCLPWPAFDRYLANSGSERADFEHYTQQDGLPGLECNANAAFIDSRGNLWLGVTEGAVMRPANAQGQPVGGKIPVYITGVRVGTGSEWSRQGYPVDALGLPIGLRLPHTTTRIDFDFIGISLQSPKQVEYRYMMEGVDRDWQEPTRLYSVPYPNLKPGWYTFKVIAKKEAEPWDFSSPATFTFQIRPPFWQTWWFVSLMVLLLAGIGWGIYRFYDARRRQQREQLYIRNTAEKLRLEHQALYAMMNPHFTFNALQSIQYFIHRQDRVSANKFLSNFAKLIRMNLESTKSDVISLGEEVERLKLYLGLEKMRFPEKFDYEVRVDPDVDQSGTQLPPMLLQPFVENSIKHGIMPLEKDGTIRVSVSQEGPDYLRILIEDNGIGIEASKRKKEGRPADHVSKGMQITMERMALFARMTGKQHSVQVEDVAGPDGQVTGARVRMLLPVQHSEGLHENW